MLRVKVEGLSEGDRALRRFEAQVDDLRPFWRSLGRDAGRRRPSALAATPTYRQAPKVAGLARRQARAGRHL